VEVKRIKFNQITKITTNTKKIFCNNNSSSKMKKIMDSITIKIKAIKTFKKTANTIIK